MLGFRWSIISLHVCKEMGLKTDHVEEQDVAPDEAYKERIIWDLTKVILSKMILKKCSQRETNICFRQKYLKSGLKQS